MRILMYGARAYGKTAGTSLVFGMMFMAGHYVRIIPTPNWKDLV